MPDPNKLTVWLWGGELAELERLRTGRLRLRFSAAAVNTYGINSRALSLSLPITTKRVESPSLERYLDNLLPESGLRGALERQHGVRPGDTFGLLSIIGQECAGAVQFTVPGVHPGAGRLHPLSTKEVDRIVRDLPTIVTPDDLPVSASLGGVQAKVLLTRVGDGWAWPTDGAMSTHLIKPEPASGISVNDLIWFEEWTLRLGRNAGLPVAHAQLEDFDGRMAIVVERYDRLGGTRTHQEDFAQALGIAASDKYESLPVGPGRLRQIATEAGAEASDLAVLHQDLLRLVSFNAVIGNGDAHSKNYSLRINGQGTYSLAPLYDAAPVFLVEPRFTHFGHAVNGQTNLRYITASHLVDEAVAWGVGPVLAGELVFEVAEAVARAFENTPADPRIVHAVEPIAARAARFAAQV